MPARIAGNATTRYAWVVLFRPTPENVGLRYLATLNKLTSTWLRFLPRMVQANFFFNIQKATAETSTIPQAKTIRIKLKNKICLNV